MNPIPLLKRTRYQLTDDISSRLRRRQTPATRGLRVSTEDVRVSTARGAQHPGRQPRPIAGEAHVERG